MRRPFEPLSLVLEGLPRFPPCAPEVRRAVAGSSDGANDAPTWHLFARSGPSTPLAARIAVCDDLGGCAQPSRPVPHAVPWPDFAVPPAPLPAFLSAGSIPASRCPASPSRLPPEHAVDS